LKLPKREHAVIAREKLIGYLLNHEHKRGGTKAKLLEQFGYVAVDWQRLANDIRAQLETEAPDRLWNALRNSDDPANPIGVAIDRMHGLANRRRQGFPALDYTFS
jgi:hypothetical protein